MTLFNMHLTSLAQEMTWISNIIDGCSRPVHAKMTTPPAHSTIPALSTWFKDTAEPIDVDAPTHKHPNWKLVGECVKGPRSGKPVHAF